MLSDVAKPTHLFGVLEVLEESLLLPGDTLAHVGGGVRVVRGLTGLAAENTGRAVSTVEPARPTRRRTRAGLDRPCVARQHRGCGTAHSGS